MIKNYNHYLPFLHQLFQHKNPCTESTQTSDTTPLIESLPSIKSCIASQKEYSNS